MESMVRPPAGTMEITGSLALVSAAEECSGRKDGIISEEIRISAKRLTEQAKDKRLALGVSLNMLPYGRHIIPCQIILQTFMYSV